MLICMRMCVLMLMRMCMYVDVVVHDDAGVDVDMYVDVYVCEC